MQGEVVLPAGENPVLLHSGELPGEAGTLQVQVVCQLLAVEGNVKRGGVLLQGDRVEVGQKPATAAFRGGVKAPLGESQVLAGTDLQEVLQQLLLPRGGGEVLEDPNPQEENPAVLIGLHVHQQRLLEKGKALCKHLPPLDHGQDGAVAPEVCALDGDAPGEHDPHLLGGVPGGEQDSAPGHLLLMGL